VALELFSEAECLNGEGCCGAGTAGRLTDVLYAYEWSSLGGATQHSDTTLTIHANNWQMLETISTVSISRHLVTGINAQCALQYCNMSMCIWSMLSQPNLAFCYLGRNPCQTRYGNKDLTYAIYCALSKKQLSRHLALTRSPQRTDSVPIHGKQCYRSQKLHLHSVLPVTRLDSWHRKVSGCVSNK